MVRIVSESGLFKFHDYSLMIDIILEEKVILDQNLFLLRH